MSFVQHYSIEKAALFGYKIKTHAYYYALENDNYNEIVAFHWHPDGDSPVDSPHLHIGLGAGRDLRQEIYDIHFRTDRLAFEEFCLLLLIHFKVVPERRNADLVLKANLEKFKQHRTWPVL